MATTAPEIQHQITIGKSPLTSAEIAASLIRGDVRDGVAEPPGPHVVYRDKAGVDQSLSPAQLNAAGEGNCASIPRAVAPFVDASHVMVAEIPQADGSVMKHTALLSDAKAGEPGIKVGADGRLIGAPPAERVIDPSTALGMNGGKPVDPKVFTNAAVAPIWPAGSVDLSHVHADPADRAAEGNAHQGVERLHTPETPAGDAVAQVSHLAARLVTPPPAAEPRPVYELYPGHPILSEFASVEDAAKSALERVVPWKTSLPMVGQYAAGLTQLAKGTNPAPLSGDPPITAAHVEAAKVLDSHLATLINAQMPNKSEAVKVGAVKDLVGHADRLKTADRNDPAHDQHAQAFAELDSMLPGIVPQQVRQHLTRPAEPDEDEEEEIDFLGFAGDRGDDFALGIATMGIGLSEETEHALHAVAAGCPGDGHRRQRPPRRQLDPRMGALVSGPGGGGGGVPTMRASSPLAPSGGVGPGSPMLPEGSRGAGGWGRGEGMRFGDQLGGGGDLLVGGDDDDNDTDEDDDDEDGGTTVFRSRRIIQTQAPDRVVQLPGQTRYVRGQDRVVEVPGQTQYLGAPTFVTGAPSVSIWDRLRGRGGPPGQWQGRAQGGWGQVGNQGGRFAVGGGQTATGRQISASRAEAANPTAANMANLMRANGQTPTGASVAAAIAAKNAPARPPGDPSRPGQPIWNPSTDPANHGIGDPFRPDRYFVGDRSRSLAFVLNAYRTLPWVKARLDSGLPYHGISLVDIEAAMAPALPVPFFDPAMGGGAGLPKGGSYKTTQGNFSYKGGSYPSQGQNWNRQGQTWPPPAPSPIFAPPQVVVQQAPVYVDTDGNPIDPSMGGMGRGGGRGGRGFGRQAIDEDDDAEDLFAPVQRVACSRCAS